MDNFENREVRRGDYHPEENNMHASSFGSEGRKDRGYTNGDYPHRSEAAYEYSYGLHQTPHYEYHYEGTGAASSAENNTTPSPKKKKKSRAGVRAASLALCCALLGGAVGLGGGYLGANLAKNSEKEESAEHIATMVQGKRESTVIDVANIDTSKEMTAAEVYAANVNSTVGIKTSAVTTNLWGQQTMSAASGSGFIITADGYILTNYHVVEGSDSISVSMYDGSTYDAELIGYDESNDIAVLKIDADGLTPVILGDSDNLNVGDSVVAIGNPLGELTFSLTSGAVSALDREVTLSSSVTMELIQTDCAINSGNSGGALFNLYGEVIGITNAKYSGSGSSSSASIDNIGFAIPINHVRSIVDSIIENGYIAKPYIGVVVGDVSSETQSFGLPGGAAVRGVTEGGPAEAAGLKENDIITEANGKEITSGNDLVDVVSECKPGDKLELVLYRGGEEIEITVEVGEQIKSALENEETSDEEYQSGQQGMQIFPWGNGGFMN